MIEIQGEKWKQGRTYFHMLRDQHEEKLLHLLF